MRQSRPAFIGNKPASSGSFEQKRKLAKGPEKQNIGIYDSEGQLRYMYNDGTFDERSILQADERTLIVHGIARNVELLNDTPTYEPAEITGSIVVGREAALELA